ncbi:hypothetical protein AB0P21_30110 [Kribbella sp. NPDC056861]|uniref:hypothetical protein n=1 Tax=Kribbella sp. NPDC056861 TaxID=3154857 RepID=UPI00342F2579
MDYDQFDIEFRRVHKAAGGGMSKKLLQAQIGRLRRLAETIEDPRARENAGYDIAMLDDLLAHDEDPPQSALMTEAFDVYRKAAANSGSTADRIARVEAGIEDIEHIADRAPVDEQLSIGSLNESLYMLISALRA